MKDNYLREQLIKTGIIDKDLWGSTSTKEKLTEAYAVGNWFKYTKASESKKVEVLEKKLAALAEHLKLEEVYIPDKGSTYQFRKKTKKKG